MAQLIFLRFITIVAESNALRDQLSDRATEGGGRLTLLLHRLYSLLAAVARLVDSTDTEGIP